MLRDATVSNIQLRELIDKLNGSHDEHTKIIADLLVNAENFINVLSSKAIDGSKYDSYFAAIENALITYRNHHPDDPEYACAYCQNVINAAYSVCKLRNGSMAANLKQKQIDQLEKLLPDHTHAKSNTRTKL